MPVHKFINKSDKSSYRLTWILKDNKYPPAQQDSKWEVFAQETITIDPGKIFTANLGLGIEKNYSSCFVSLRQTLKQKKCCLLDSVISEDVDDIIVNIQNNSSSAVVINEGDSRYTFAKHLIIF